MPKRARGLTIKGIEALGKGYHADGGGLYLQVAGNGGRSWIFRYQRNGKRRDMGLGPAYLVGLAEARRLTLECRRCLFEGIDPLERKRSRLSTAMGRISLAEPRLDFQFLLWKAASSATLEWHRDPVSHTPAASLPEQRT